MLPAAGAVPAPSLRGRVIQLDDMGNGDVDDLELHRRLSTGDRDAFDALYRRYAPTAYGLAYRLTGQQMLAQDVVHDAFMALWRAPEAFDPARGAFRTFFLSLVHHRAVDTVRREERLRKRTERAANLEPLTGEDPAEDVVDDAFIEIRRREVREALATLPPDHNDRCSRWRISRRIRRSRSPRSSASPSAP